MADGVTLTSETIRMIAKVHAEHGAACELRHRADELEMSANEQRLTLPPEGDPARDRVSACILMVESIASELRVRADEIASGTTTVYLDALVDAGMPRTILD